MNAAAKLLAEAMALPEDEREELAAKLLDSLEPPTGISVDDRPRSSHVRPKHEAEQPRFRGTTSSGAW